MVNMENKQELVNLDNSEDILKNIVESFYDIPFGNSKFQIEKFIISGNVTPERAYRAIGLELYDKLQTLLDEKYNRIRLSYEIEIRKAQIMDLEEGSYERMVQEIELTRIMQKIPFTEKLINDAIEECNVLYSWFKKFPKYTREEFENGEYNYYLEKAKRESIGITGPKESLFNILEDSSSIKETIDKMRESDPADWQKIRDEMPSLLKLEIDSRPDRIEIPK